MVSPLQPPCDCLLCLFLVSADSCVLPVTLADFVSTPLYRVHDFEKLPGSFVVAAPCCDSVSCPGLGAVFCGDRVTCSIIWVGMGRWEATPGRIPPSSGGGILSGCPAGLGVDPWPCVCQLVDTSSTLVPTWTESELGISIKV